MTLLKDKLAGRRLILASHSPRRSELMRQCGLDFVTADSGCDDESFPDTLDKEDVPVYLARKKSAAYAVPLAPDQVLVTADTIVICNGEILGKPADRADAERMLQKLSGNRHRVVTGVEIRSATKSECFSVKTDVWFRRLSEEEIEYYLDNYAPYDKAGAYGIQEWIGAAAIERIEGSFYNVMGLPIQTLYVKLNEFLD